MEISHQAEPDTEPDMMLMVGRHLMSAPEIRLGAAALAAIERHRLPPGSVRTAPELSETQTSRPGIDSRPHIEPGDRRSIGDETRQAGAKDTPSAACRGATPGW